MKKEIIILVLCLDEEAYFLDEDEFTDEYDIND